MSGAGAEGDSGEGVRPATCPISPSRDLLHRLRGRCLACGECPAYICLELARVLCDYCGCPPARHQREGDLEEDLERLTAGLAL